MKNIFSVEETDTQTLEAVKVEPEKMWHVVVVNDPVNLMSYVTMVFKKVFQMNNHEATKHMMQVHQDGKSILWTGEREKAETYVYLLQQWQLTSKLEHDARN